jgi:1,4-alpha-glucan branching enzyme
VAARPVVIGVSRLKLKGSFMTIHTKTSHKWKESLFEKLLVMNTLQNHPATGHHPSQSSRKPVNFFCAAPSAVTVELVGDFNHWHPFPMMRSLDGWWLAQLHLTHGHHQYRFLVDGKPVLDPQATGVTQDERGEKASLVAVS